MFLYAILCFVGLASSFPSQYDTQKVYRTVNDFKNEEVLKSELRKELQHAILYRPFSSHGSRKHSNLTALDTSACGCTDYNCGCCVHLEWDSIHLNDTVCANFSYIPAPVYGISVTLSLDGNVIINETVSASNPPPICVGVPYLEKLASVCLKFEDLAFTNNSLSGCIRIQARLEGIVVEDYLLGCFVIPPKKKLESSGVDKNLYYSSDRGGAVYFP